MKVEFRFLFLQLLLLLNTSCSVRISQQDAKKLLNCRDTIITHLLKDFTSNNQIVYVDSNLIFRNSKYYMNEVNSFICKGPTGSEPNSRRSFDSKQKYYIPDGLNRVLYYDGRDLKNIFEHDIINLVLFTPIYIGVDNKIHLMAHYFISNFYDNEPEYIIRTNSIKVFTIAKRKGKFKIIDEYDACKYKDKDGVENVDCNISTLNKKELMKQLDQKK